MRKFLRSLIAPVLTALIVGGLANGAFYQWSITANNNSNADPNVNWSEGMSPSSVNDSARAMMAALAAYRNDSGGALTTAGTATAYTVTTFQGMPTVPITSQFLTVKMHATNGVNPTLRADGGTIYPIQSSPGVAVASGSLIAGTPYPMTFNGTAWILHSFYQNANFVPVGAVIPYAGTTAPNSNFAFVYGQCVSRTTYAALFALVSTTYGACDGSTTFGLPDIRGRVVAGKDDMGGVSANRLTSPINGDTLGAAGGTENHTITQAQIPNYSLVTSGLSIAAGAVVTNVVLNQSDGGRTSGGVETIESVSITQTKAGVAVGGTMSSGGSGSAHTIVQPTFILNYIIRVI